MELFNSTCSISYVQKSAAHRHSPHAPAGPPHKAWTVVCFSLALPTITYLPRRPIRLYSAIADYSDFALSHYICSNLINHKTPATAAAHRRHALAHGTPQGSATHQPHNPRSARHNHTASRTRESRSRSPHFSLRTQPQNSLQHTAYFLHHGADGPYSAAQNPLSLHRCHAPPVTRAVQAAPPPAPLPQGRRILSRRRASRWCRAASGSRGRGLASASR